MQVEADFNVRDKDGNVLVLADQLDDSPPSGSTVLVRDAEGNSAVADVLGKDDGLIRVAVRWQTWVPAPEPIEIG